MVWLSGIVGSGKETAWAGGGLITLSKGFHTIRPFVKGKAASKEVRELEQKAVKTQLLHKYPCFSPN